jgi:predicted ester cyclase
MKRIYPMIIFLLTLVGCQNSLENVEFNKLKEKAQTEQENTVIIEKLFKSFNNKNIQVYKELSSQDYQYFFPSSNATPQNKEDMVEQLQTGFNSSANMKYQIDNIFASNNYVFVSYSFSGIHKDNLFDIPTTGNDFSVSSFIVFDIEDGQIVTVKEQADVLGLMMQLNMELKPSE